MGKYLNKPAPDPSGSLLEALSPSGEFAILHPALWEFLTLVRWEDGSTRVPGSATLFWDTPSWKLCLSCKDSGRVAFCSSTSVEGAFSAAEEGLVRSTLDWRAQNKNGTRRART